MNSNYTIMQKASNGKVQYSTRLKRSLRAIRKACSMNPDSVLLVLFGSRARGTATKKSDADFYHIVRKNKWSDANWSALNKQVSGGLQQQYTILTDTTRTFKKYGNLYGTAEYWALREGHVIYEAHGADCIYAGIVDYSKTDVKECSKQWLNLAKRHLTEGRTYTDNNGLADTGFTCHMARKSINDSIKAILLNARIKFPFVRDFHTLCNMSPLTSDIIEKFDLERADGWHMRPWECGYPRHLFTQNDQSEAIRSAQAIYKMAARVLLH